MLKADSRLRINVQEIASKVIDGEAIIINLESGIYYSMDGVGGQVWAFIIEGRSLREISEAVSARHAVTRSQAEADVERLVSELLEENLVQLSSELAAEPIGELTVEPAEEKGGYEPPELHTYRDMADLLALDPPMPGLRATPWQGPDETEVASGRGA